MHGLGAAVVLGGEGVVFPCLMRSFERRCYEYEKIFLLVLFFVIFGHSQSIKPNNPMKPDFFSSDFQNPPPFFPGTKNERKKPPPLGVAQGTGIADIRHSREAGHDGAIIIHEVWSFGVKTAMAMKAEKREKIGLRGVFLP